MMRIALMLCCIASTAGASDWQLRLDEDVKLSITHHQAPVVSMQYHFWGKGWSYAGANLDLGYAAGNGYPFGGEILKLGIKVEGKAEKLAPNRLRLTYDLTLTQTHPEIIGGGVEFNVKLNSPALTQPGEPALLDNQLGWRWPIGDDAVAVQFDQPAASVYFERDQKHRIRCYFVGTSLEPGSRRIVMTIRLPRGGTIAPTLAERYGPADVHSWPVSPLDLIASPVDLRHLNRDDRPAGRRGFIRAQGDQLVFADGTPARFWGTNIAAYALFIDKDRIQQQARRIAALGYNLVRLHHHDSTRWVNPTVIDKSRNDSQHLDEHAMDRLHWWIKCLKNEGVYVWLDLHVGRQFKPGDDIPGFEELEKNQGEGKGFCYLNERVRELMVQFQADYVNHRNPYTKVAMKDEPAIIGMLITNENDVTFHFGHVFHPERGHPYHQQLYEQAMQSFASRTGLPIELMRITWEPGPGMLFLNELEHGFNRVMLEHLRGLGVKAPIATTNNWGHMNPVSLPALNDSDLIDVHVYGGEEALNANPHYAPNYLTWVAAAQVHDKPLAITEWNVPYPSRDRFTSPMYMAATASLQGWDAPMIYNYSQRDFWKPDRPYPWSTFSDPGLTAIMPTAALAFRRGDIQPAKEQYCLVLNDRQLFHEPLGARSSAAIRTLAERSRLTVALPDAPQLDWDAATPVGKYIRRITDPNRDFLAADAEEVVSDTGELRRNWMKGVHTIDTPRTQVAQGWIGGQDVQLRDLTVHVKTRKAVIAVTSLDDQPINQSRRLLITNVARVMPSKGGRLPYRCEPVQGGIVIRSTVRNLKLFALDGKGRRGDPVRSEFRRGAYHLPLPAPRWSLWYELTDE